MSKTKDSAKLSKKDSKKADTAVKAGRVTKPTQTPKAKSKEIAKSAASSKGVKEELKKKKKAKEPTPEPESESESSASESEADSDSSASSSEDEKVTAKASAKAKADDSSDASDSDSSDDSSESESEEEAPKVKGGKANGVPVPKAAAKDESDSDSSSESDESESEDEKPAVKAKVNGAAKAAKTAKADESSDSDSDDSASDDSESESGAKAASDSDSDSDDSSDSSASETEKEEAPSKKRKAESAAEPVVKKTKTEAAGTAGEGVKNLFVGNLSWNVDEDWLSREFGTYGEITGVRIISDRDTGRSRGFGYVEFATSEAAAKAKEGLHGSELDGRALNIDFSTPRQNNGTQQERTNSRAERFADKKSNPSNTLFIGNLSFDADNATVQSVFAEYGEVGRVSLPTDRETGQPKGFGYVDFSTVEEATAALEALNGSDVAGRAIRIDFASPRDNNGPSRGGFGGRGDRGGRGGGRGRGRGGFGDRGGRGGGRGGRGGFSTNRGGFGDYKGNKVSFD